MDVRGPFLFILLIISAFLFRGQLIVEKTIAGNNNTGHAYHTCELRASTNNRRDNSRLLINDNTPGQVLHTRIVRTVHFIKSNTIITGTALGVRQYLKHIFYASDDAFIPSTELLLFPHHTFW